MVFEIIVFVLILSFLVFIHELGHFSTAKFFKIKVEEFGLGLPPRAWGKKIGETIYSLNWLPLGGFVQIKGESFNDYDPKDDRNFINKRPWQKFIVLVAGVVMNTLLAVIIFYITIGSNGWKSNPLIFLEGYQFPLGNTVVMPNVVIGVSDGSPAAKSGFEFGDRIIEMKSGGSSAALKNIGELRSFISDKGGKEIEVKVKNVTNGTEKTLMVTPQYNDDAKQPALGVSLREAVEIHYDTPMQKAFAGFEQSINTMSYNYSILKMLVSISVKTHDVQPVAQSVSGPIGIFDVVKSVLNSGTNRVFMDVLDLTAMISLSLAVMNLLPIPALDGGRIVFVLIEWITGKRPSQKLEAKAHQIGFFFLISLILVITFKDIWQLFRPI